MVRMKDDIENASLTMNTESGSSQEPCNVVIMCTAGNLGTLAKMLPYCAANILHDHIYVVASRNIEESVNALPFAEFVDEDSVLEGLQLSVIADIIESIAGERRRAGWYFQQFLKMAWAMRCPDRYYIVIDADTFPLHPITFLQDGKYLLTEKIEYNQAYFDTLAVLFDGEIGRVCDCSFVAENMIFDCEVMKEMIMKIENNVSIRGGVFYEKILYAVNPKDILRSGFSEFETYGNYIMTCHPEMVSLRKLRTLRESTRLFGSNPSDEQIAWAALDYDIISVEGTDYPKTFLTTVTKWKLTRKLFRAKTLADARQKVRSAYRKLTGKADFRFE